MYLFFLIFFLFLFVFLFLFTERKHLHLNYYYWKMERNGSFFNITLYYQCLSCTLACCSYYSLLLVLIILPTLLLPRGGGGTIGDIICDKLSPLLSSSLPQPAVGSTAEMFAMLLWSYLLYFQRSAVFRPGDVGIRTNDICWLSGSANIVDFSLYFYLSSQQLCMYSV